MDLAAARALSVVVLVFAAVAAGGCSLSGTKTVSASGEVGATLAGPSGMQVQLMRYAPHVTPGVHDVSGLATPKPGTHFASVLVRICITKGDLPVISERNFTMHLADGGDAELKFPQTRYADDFDLVGSSGCEQGYIVFQVPRGGVPDELRFALDIRKGSVNGFSDDTNVRMSWAL